MWPCESVIFPGVCSSLSSSLFLPVSFIVLYVPFTFACYFFFCFERLSMPIVCFLHSLIVVIPPQCAPFVACLGTFSLHVHLLVSVSTLNRVFTLVLYVRKLLQYTQYFSFPNVCCSCDFLLEFSFEIESRVSVWSGMVLPRPLRVSASHP